MGVLNKVFFKIGYFSATNPVAAILGAMFFTVVFGMGMINLRLTVRKACDPSTEQPSGALGSSIFKGEHRVDLLLESFR